MTLMKRLERLKLWDKATNKTYDNPKVGDDQVDPDPATDGWHPPMEEDEKIDTNQEILRG